ncbi:hypothetical protein [uncultured Rhodospira sp.]|uniref:hypothetical protein n=1 Tax=uncultured Rhodospira sp. TaxID=1936189 RepID=UPI0026274262|nr:hypothetical protein [uncultured Rhodospira sp.]
MDGFDFGELLDMLIPALVGVAGIAIGHLWGRLKEIVKQTDAQWDDELVRAVEDGIGMGRDEAKAKIKEVAATKGAVTAEDVDAVV